MVTKKQQLKRKQVPWNKGKKFSEEVIEKMRLAKRRFYDSGGVAWAKGKVRTEEHKKNLSRSSRGKTPWNKGKKLSVEHVKNLRIAHAGQNTTPRGEKSRFWRGGITSLRGKIRNLKEYKQWRKSIYARDKYTCVLCGSHGGQLQADHFNKSFSELLQDAVKRFGKENIISAITTFSEFWDINNGRTLCVPCHRATSNFGWRQVNKNNGY